MRLIFRLMVPVFAVIFCLSCSVVKKVENMTAEELLTEGDMNFKKGNYLKAIDFYDNLKGWFPTSKYCVEAEFKTADAYYELGRYEEAMYEYSTFVKLHPKNEKIAYCIYRMGECNFERIRTIDRDQSWTIDALSYFERVKREFPGSYYAKKARASINKCRQNLAGHELYIGEFYYKSGEFEAAEARFAAILKSYPDIEDICKKARDYIERCSIHIKNKENL